MKNIKIGTRGSKLALIQANMAKEMLLQYFPDHKYDIVTIKTKGDRVTDVPLSRIGEKGLFTKEIEEALLDGRIDMAVHSLKDVQSVFPEGLTLGGVLPRGEVRDALVTNDNRKLHELNEKDKIATSSLRRKAQLLSYNKNFNIIDIRGNVDTRLKKLDEGYCSALVIAAAGLQRSGYEEKISELVPPDIILPAVCQGIIGIEIRTDDNNIRSMLHPVTCVKTMVSAIAERAFLETVEGGCQVPAGCYTSITDNIFRITGFISGLKGESVIKKGLAGPVHEAKKTAVRLAGLIMDYGGRKILERIRGG